MSDDDGMGFGTDDRWKDLYRLEVPVFNERPGESRWEDDALFLVQEGVDDTGDGVEDKETRLRLLRNMGRLLWLRAAADGAREERARIVAFLGRAVETFTYGRHFERKWSPATGRAVRDMVDAIERGEHEEKAT